MTVQDDLATLRGCVANCAMESGEGHRGIGEGALDRVVAEIARLERENEHLHLRIARKNESLNVAEAEVARIRDGLRRIASFGSRYGPSDEAEIARALLAEDGAA